LLKLGCRQWFTNEKVNLCSCFHKSASRRSGILTSGLVPEAGGSFTSAPLTAGGILACDSSIISLAMFVEAIHTQKPLSFDLYLTFECRESFCDDKPKVYWCFACLQLFRWAEMSLTSLGRSMLEKTMAYVLSTALGLPLGILLSHTNLPACV